MTRRPLITRSRAIAWVVSLALGVALVTLLRLFFPDDTGSGSILVMAVLGLFGTLLGVLIATGVVVTVMRLLGNPTRAVSSAPGELPADFTTGICVALFSLPSLIAYLGWFFGG